MSDKPSAFQEEILLLAEKLGEVSDRIAKIETEFATQAAPLDAAKAGQDATLAALNAALAGIKALNFHVLDNNLGAVSKRVEEIQRQADVALRAVEDRIAEMNRQREADKAELARKVEAGESRRTELAQKRDEDAKAFEAKVTELRSAIEWAQKTLATEIANARKEFATPAGLNPRGQWSGAETYARLDVVTLNGTSYISVDDGNAEKPSKTSRKWQVLASRGGSAALGGGATDITGVAGVGATGLQLAQAGTEDEARTILGVADVVGATADDDGEAGRVPQPDAGEQGYFLRGDGTWAAASVVTAALATKSEARAGTDNEKYISPFTGNARALLGDLTRQTSDVLFSNGATSNRRGEATFGTAGAVAGMPISIPFEFDVPTSNYAGNLQYVVYIGSTATPLPTSVATNLNTLQLVIDAAGGLGLYQIGAVSGDRRSINYAAFRATYSGQRVRGSVVFAAPDTTTKPVIYLNGVDASASFSDNNAGTIPNWMPTTLDTTKFLSGYNFTAGRFVPHAPILGALTANEVLEWTTTGRLPTWCEVGTGSAVALNATAWLNNYSTDFATFASTDGSGFTASDTREARVVRVRVPTGTLSIGHTYAIDITATFSEMAVTAYLSTDGYGASSVYSILTSGVAKRWVVNVIDSAALTSLMLICTTSGVDVDHTVAVTGVKVTRLGPLAKWEIQPAATCYDAGTNKIPLVLTAGITPITQRRDWIIQGQTTTNGNQQLLGASVFVAPYDFTRHMIDSIEVNGTSTATVGVGSASGGAQYVTAAAIASGRNRRTLVTPIPGTANIWVSSNATDTLQHTIRGHIVD